MAIVGTVTLTIKPGRMEDYVELARKAKVVLEKHGSKNIRLLSAVVAGEATGAVVFVSETDSFAANGSVLDSFFADPDSVPILAESNSADGPVDSYQLATWTDVPL